MQVAHCAHHVELLMQPDNLVADLLKLVQASKAGENGRALAARPSPAPSELWRHPAGLCTRPAMQNNFFI